MNCLQAAERRR